LRGAYCLHHQGDTSSCIIVSIIIIHLLSLYDWKPIEGFSMTAIRIEIILKRVTCRNLHLK
jgi:hypothetical protein